MPQEFEKEHEGMHVVTRAGDTVGKVESVHGKTAEVKPEAGLSQSIRRRLGWTDKDMETFKLDYSNIREVKGDKIHLKQ